MTDEEFFYATLLEHQRRVLWFAAWGVIGLAYAVDRLVGVVR